MENLNGHETGNGGHSQGDTYRQNRPSSTRREDSERCWPYAAVPVLYLFAQVIQEQWSFYSQWRVAAPLLIAQAFMSDLFLWDVAYYPGYMAHYMSPDLAFGYLLTFLCGAALLVTVRYWPSPFAPSPTERTV